MVIFPHEDVWSKADFDYYFGKNISFVAMDEHSNICGYIFVKQLDDAFCIANFGVVPDQQKQGIGKRLMETVLTTLVNQGQIEVNLQVRKTNNVALHLYKKFGFQIESADDKWFQMKLTIDPKATQKSDTLLHTQIKHTKKEPISSHLILGLVAGGCFIAGLGLIIASIAVASIPIGIVGTGCLLAAGFFAYKRILENSGSTPEQLFCFL